MKRITRRSLQIFQGQYRCRSTLMVKVSMIPINKKDTHGEESVHDDEKKIALTVTMMRMAMTLMTSLVFIWVHLIVLILLYAAAFGVIALAFLCIVVLLVAGTVPYSFLLPLHPSILEPDFNLSLGEAHGLGDLDASLTRQVAVIVELLLQLQRLSACVGLATAFAIRTDDVGTWKKERKKTE